MPKAYSIRFFRLSPSGSASLASTPLAGIDNSVLATGAVAQVVDLVLLVIPGRDALRTGVIRITVENSGNGAQHTQQIRVDHAGKQPRNDK